MKEHQNLFHLGIASPEEPLREGQGHKQPSKCKPIARYRAKVLQ